MATATRTAWMEDWGRDLVPSEAAQRSEARIQARTSSRRYYGREATARLPQPVPEAPKTQHLAEVEVRRVRRPRWGLIVLTMFCVAMLLSAAIVCPILVRSAATGMETSLGQTQQQQRALAVEADTLAAQIAALSAPDRVAKEANKLGMQPAPAVHYVDVDAGVSAMEGDTTVAGR